MLIDTYTRGSSEKPVTIESVSIKVTRDEGDGRWKLLRVYAVNGLGIGRVWFRSLDMARDYVDSFECQIVACFTKESRK